MTAVERARRDYVGKGHTALWLAERGPIRPAVWLLVDPLSIALDMAVAAESDARRAARGQG